MKFPFITLLLSQSHEYDKVVSLEEEEEENMWIVSTIWKLIFKSKNDDLEKRLHYISKQETLIMDRINLRFLYRRKTSHQLILFSLLFQVIAVGYGIMSSRTMDMNWKMKAIRVLPMFLLPALSTASYSTFLTFIRMCDSRDQKILERLRAERKAKIDELKEKTNYYTTQQLIQRYDTDPSAKAAAASVLASKLGADSGLKVYVDDESKPGAPTSKITRNRSDQQLVGSGVNDQTQTSEHHQSQSITKNNGGWIARVAALLVGEDPSQSYALICGNCHMHNGLAQKEDFTFMSYYCQHCHALNKPKQLGEYSICGLNSPNTDIGEVPKKATASEVESIIKSNSPINDNPEIQELSQRANLVEKAS
ncbi:hypothetical protein Lal_00039454 [Lupinus albus]|uniref:Putative Lunapark domain-containing protein n=1 Tax=Lupinus albus TaxID=3870 RepID=A0A6A5NKK6_LUPAL|nr:putative Lunapark domain-containing protein [Lupinus albus]KAF1885609.1 hypothetical protein Lal_00039454 [Lupinus albus]